jgi:AraC-like DNA-binding protein
MKRSLVEIHFRNTVVPDVKMPFSVRSVGHYIADCGWSEKNIIFRNFIQLFWGVSGKGYFVIDGQEYILEPGMVTYYLRGEQHELRAVTDDWNYRWFTFDGADADAFFKAFEYPREPFSAGPCPEDLFIQLTEEIYDSSPFGLRNIGATAYAIMAAAGGIPKYESKNDRLVARFIKLLEECYDEPETNVSSLADELGVHRSTLNRAFSEKMQISPVEYLTGFRIQRALAMLRTTSLPVAEVGQLNGYPDPCYFSKIVKKAVGVSPEVFRLKS